MVQLDYAKGLLRVGEAPKINVTTVEEVPQSMIDKMSK
jgi:hypothetical protein